jgi:hypothetical protein
MCCARCGRTYFDILVLGEECARPKPHPDPYQEALKAFGLQPHEAIVCEDSPAGAPAHACATDVAVQQEQCPLHVGVSRACMHAYMRREGMQPCRILKILMPCPCASHARLYSQWRMCISGTAAGVAAGVPVVGILTSQTEQRMLKAGCSLTVKDYTELEALAKQHDAAAANGKLA